LSYCQQSKHGYYNELKTVGAAASQSLKHALTGMQKLYARVGQVDRDVILEPENRRLGIAGSAADHHRVAVFLDSLQCWALHDAWIAARSCTTESIM